jgi:hypothetical protein
MQLSVKDKRRFRNIDWLMPSVDVVDVLERLGVESINVRGYEVDAMCPDHHMFVGHEPSHPRWSCNIDTGDTYCFTEPRGSNLLWTVTRKLDCHPREAVKFMTGSDMSKLQTSAILGKIGKIRNKKRDEKKDPVKLDDIRRDLVDRYISDSCYDFFIHPPNKAPTNIKRETVDRYQVFERCWGYYGNRAIIPFFMHGELVGFCAIDLLGEKRWLVEYPLKEADEYRKSLYPLNFRAKECLFGYDDVEVGCEQLFITEGAREVMKITQEGFPNAVGCLKAELSDEQIIPLTKKAPKEFVLFFDGDEAGWSATDKNAKKLQKLSPVRKCYLPVGKDPKNLCAEEMKNIIKRSKLA